MDGPKQFYLDYNDLLNNFNQKISHLFLIGSIITIVKMKTRFLSV